MNETVKLPIGIENFEKMRTEGFYYVDKTGFIKDLLDNWGGSKPFYPPPAVRQVLKHEHAPLFF